MMKNIIVIGAGGMGKEALWLIERINEVEPTWNILGVLDDSLLFADTTVNNYSVLGGCNDVTKYKNAYFVCAIGSSIVRKRVVEKIQQINPSIKFATLIDPSVIISDHVQIGEGTIICAQSIITVNVKIGNHSLINLDCKISHDCILNQFATLYPSVNLSGNTIIGDCCEIGVGSVVIQSCRVGNEAIVGAGAVVIRDIPPHCTAVGCPAKPIKFSN